VKAIYLRSRQFASTFALAAALVLTLPGAAEASVSATPDDTAKLAGGGYALAQVGTRTLVGGTFTKLGGKPRQNIGAVRADGTVDPTFIPSTNGKVDAIAVSDDGTRVFLGGSFTTVDGQARANLAAVDATTGDLIEGWKADTTGTTPEVKSLVVHGDRLYVAGKFGGIGGTTRKRLQVVSVSTGAVETSFNAKVVGGIREVELSPDAGTLYIGGAYTSLGGQSRLGIGAVDAVTGAPTSFAPSETGGNIVSIGLSPDGSRLWFGTDNNTVYMYNVISNSPVYLFKMSGNTQAIAASNTEVYFGGHFSQSIAEKIHRAFLASFNPATGKLTSWDPGTDGGKMGVWDLMIEGNHVHAAGVFTTFGSGAISQRGYARFSGTP
jgi:hypothetical protein